MTNKVYKTAMGKEVDLGALLLQNEHVRAVGNMNVNAKGDVLDSTNKIIDQKSRQVQRQYQKQTTNVSADIPVHTSNVQAKRALIQTPEEVVEVAADDVEDVLEVLESPAPVDPVVEPTAEPIAEPAVGGLAAAIARSKTIKQEQEKSARQAEQDKPIRKI